MNVDGPPSNPQDVFSRRASFYSTSKVHDDKATLTKLVELCRPEKHMMVLDAGTGAGHTALALAPHVHEVYALDVTEAMLVEGRKLSRERGIFNVRFEKGDVTSIPHPDGSFDIITCRRAAHHFHDLNASLREMARVLRLGGRMVIDDRSVPEDDEVDRTINLLDRLHDPSHVRDRRPSEWTSLLTEAGLKVESMERYRKRVPLSHFTNMVEKDVAEEMRRVASTMSAHCAEAVHLESTEGGMVLDNFFVLIAATKT